VTTSDSAIVERADLPRLAQLTRVRDCEGDFWRSKGPTLWQSEDDPTLVVTDEDLLFDAGPLTPAGSDHLSAAAEALTPREEATIALATAAQTGVRLQRGELVDALKLVLAPDDADRMMADLDAMNETRFPMHGRTYQATAERGAYLVDLVVPG
jgi:hypothetical protein